MVVCSSTLWHVGTQTQAGVADHPHLKKNGLFIHCHRVPRCAFPLKFSLWFLLCKKLGKKYPVLLHNLCRSNWDTVLRYSRIVVVYFVFNHATIFPSLLRYFPVTPLLSLTCFSQFLITFPFLYFCLGVLDTSGGIHWCWYTLCTLPTQHPSRLPHLTAVRLPLGVFEVIPSCSGTAHWCCWSGAPWHGGWHPAHSPHTHSPAGPTVAEEGSGPSG